MPGARGAAAEAPPPGRRSRYHHRVHPSLPLLLAARPARAGDLRFPASDADYGYYYPTAYYDHGGSTDWACADLTYGGHQGSDFGVGSWEGMEAGREIVAAAAGVVLTTNDGVADDCSTGDCDGGGGYGNYVWLQHADGSQTIYGHMRTWTVAVSPGQSVACGQHLGEVGSSGYSTGPHLHFEVRDPHGNRVDPFQGDCSGGASRWVDQGSHGGLPAPTCADLPACQPALALTCGDVVSTRNDAAGSTTTHAFYGCSTYTYTGPELALEVRSAAAETVTVRLTGLSADLDLYALSDAACDATGCLAASVQPDASDEALSFTATAGQAAVIVVDGYEGAVSDFTLSVECGSPWVEEGGDSGQGGGADGGDGSGTTPGQGEEEPPPGSDPGGRTPLEEVGVGCSSGPLGPLWTLALFVALAPRRRRP